MHFCLEFCSIVPSFTERYSSNGRIEKVPIDMWNNSLPGHVFVQQDVVGTNLTKRRGSDVHHFHDHVLQIVDYNLVYITNTQWWRSRWGE